MSYMTLCEDFAARKDITRREARGAGLVFSGVRTTIGAFNALERLS